MPPTSLGNSGENGKKTPALPLTLTGVEVVHLADSLNEWTASLVDGDGLTTYQRYLPLVRSALLQLGSAYVELVTMAAIEVGPVDVHITEEMAWLLRSKVRSGDIAIDGKTQIGHVLLIKLYYLLLQFNSGWADYQPVTENLDDKIVRLAEWKKSQTIVTEGQVVDASTSAPSPDTDYTEY